MSLLAEARGVGHAFRNPAAAGDSRRTRVLDDVSLGVDRGELVCLLGPNGAGKTTLARVLSGVLRPREGRSALAGTSPLELSRREVARRVAVVPQEQVVSFPFTVREMVEMGRSPRLGTFGGLGESDRAAVARALAKLGLTSLADRRFPTLSGGERQRVLLARAIAQAAPLLLLDEPTAHLDLGQRLFAFEELVRWIAEVPDRRGALVVSHDLTLAARFADRVVVLASGRVVAEGPPASALTPELIERVYQASARVEPDGDGVVSIVAQRSRIRYISRPDEPDRTRSGP